MSPLCGAAFAPPVAVGLCARFGLARLGAYLLSGAIGTLAALSVNRWYQRRQPPNRGPLESDR